MASVTGDSTTTIALSTASPPQLDSNGITGRVRSPFEIPEICLKILSYVTDQPTRREMAYVSRIFLDCTIQETNERAVTSMQHFIELLIQNIEDGESKNSLTAILRDITEKHRQILDSQGLVPLVQLKKYILNVKTQLINAIKTLDDNEITSLRNLIVRFPDFMEDIFPLTAIYKRIDQANLIRNPAQRLKALRIPVCDLVQLGYIGEGIKIAITIPDEEMKWKFLRDISRTLSEAGNTKGALDVAEMILNDHIKGQALFSLSDAFRKVDKFDEAINIVQRISEATIRDDALSETAKALIQADRLDETFNIAEKISNVHTKEIILNKMARAFIRNARLEDAIRAAEMIHFEPEMDLVLSLIVPKLIQANRIDNARRVARTIPYANTRDFALPPIDSTFMEATRSEDATMIPHLEPQRYSFRSYPI